MKETITKSKLVFILALLSFSVPTRGIVFATIGVIIAAISFVLSIENRRFKQEGKWFARSAMIFSIVSILLHLPHAWSIDKILP